MKKFSLTLALLTAAAMLFAACSPKAATPSAAAQTTPQADAIIAEGRLTPTQSMAQSFSIPGQVNEILVKEGDTVAVGQVLARLTPSADAQTALARAKQEALAAQQSLDALKTAASVTLAQSNLAVIAAQKDADKAKTAYDADKTDEKKTLLDAANTKLSAATDLQTKLQATDGLDADQQVALQARITSAQAAIASAQSLIDAAELKSTSSGVIVDPTLLVGDKVTIGQPVFIVADFSTWLVETDNLTEKDVVALKVGQKVTVTLDALPGQSFAGQITHINMIYEVKRGDTTYTVTAALNQTHPQMRWGMTAAVQFLP